MRVQLVLRTSIALGRWNVGGNKLAICSLLRVVAVSLNASRKLVEVAYGKLSVLPSTTAIFRILDPVLLI